VHVYFMTVSFGMWRVYNLQSPSLGNRCICFHAHTRNAVCIHFCARFWVGLEEIQNILCHLPMECIQVIIGPVSW
jgi:hypothetical protein